MSLREPDVNVGPKTASRQRGINAPPSSAAHRDYRKEPGALAGVGSYLTIRQALRIVTTVRNRGQ